ncbi:hypothetical protein E4U41_002751 [Claviceps citrina]|nr:hypothetical protein E4U41_002751 [Claviceps citrina]
MDFSHRLQHQQSQTPQELSPEPLPLRAPLPQSASMPLRTANSTPMSSPGLFSPTASRHNLTLPYTSLSECNTPAPPGHRPFLHPLQTHRVRETHKALIDSDNINGRKTINQYEVIEEIGRGMHGKVKLARNLETGDNVAIKIIPRFSKKRRLGKLTALSPQDKTKKEIAILKKIRHPNVVALLEVIDDPELKKIYMILEHLELGEIVWRKKGLPHICQYERRLVEREMAGGEAPTPEEAQYNQHLERRQAIKEMKRAKMAQNFAGPSDYWSVEHGAAEDSVGRGSRVSSRDNVAMMERASSPSDSRHSSASAASRSHSIASTSLLPSDVAEDISWVDDMETPGPLHSNPASTAALDGTMCGGASAEEDVRGPFRQRSASVADSIISHMSSIDYNPYAHDPYAEDYSFVPCFTLDQARSTFRDTVLGLEYLHYQGVVHRDIKPANLLWTRDHRVKISDFGVSYFGRPIRDGEADDTVSESEAKDFDDDLELAKTVGTPAFFAPELCYTDLDSGLQPNVSEQIDVWSLGVTLYCLVFARIPFLAEDEFQMFRKIATEEVHIPRRRLKPVDPSTSPAEHSLYKRHNAHPYRDDNDLDYEDVDPLLHELLKQMLIKNPEKRIRLRDIKRHPWVTHGIADVVGWLDDTDPARPSQGRKIQVDEKEVSYAVVPLTFLERARSVMKKAVGKVMHPLAERSDSRSRRRATSSVASSSGGDGLLAPAGACSQHSGFGRRSSLRAGDDYFASSSGRDVTPPGNPSQPQTTTTSNATTVHAENSSTHESAATGNDLSAVTACSRRFQRHVNRHWMAPQFLQLAPALPETQSTPATPRMEAPPHPMSTSTREGHHRWTRVTESQSDDNFRSSSIDRGLFLSADKRQHCSSHMSPVVATGIVMHGHDHHGRFSGGPPVRSLDWTRGERRHNNASSPLSASPQAMTSAAFQHGQARSDLNLQQELHGTVATNAAESTPTTDGVPGGEMQEWPGSASPCRGSRINMMTTNKSSSMESMDGVGTPSSTNPGNGATRPIRIDSAKSTSEQLPLFRSDPSLPALLSGASSVSADMEAELLSRPGCVRRSLSRHQGSSEAVTPPALVNEPAVSPIFKHPPAMEGDSLQLRLEHDDGGQSDEDVDTSSTPHVDQDGDSDDGIFLMTKSKKKSPPSMATGARPFENKRRDTGASTASNETAKKVSVSGEESILKPEPG